MPSYEHLPGFMFVAIDPANGTFVVFNRPAMGDPWLLDPLKHQWLVKKMRDGHTRTAPTLEAAKKLAASAAKGEKKW